MLRQKFMVAILVLVMAAIHAEAATIRVEQDGSGDFTEISTGILAAAPGDTVRIGAGWYQQSVPLSTGGNTEETYAAVVVDSLTIVGEGRDDVIIGPAEPDFTLQGPWGFALLQGVVTHVRIESVTVVNVKRAIEASGSVVATDLAIRDCESGFFFTFAFGLRVTNVETDRVRFPVLGGSQASDIVIRDSVFRSCEQRGVSLTNGASGVVIDGCELVDCAVILSFGSSATMQATAVLGEASVALFNGSRLEMNNCIVGSGFGNLEITGNSEISGANNVFRGGSVQTIRLSGPMSTATITNSHIFRVDGSPVVVAEAYRSEPVQIDLRGNWWGTTNADSLRAWIIDGDDLSNPPFFEELAEVLFEPFAPGPVSGNSESMGTFKARFRD